MLKKEMTYEDYDGKSVTETLYFHLSKPELIELELSYPEGIEAALKKMVEEENRSSILAFFKKIVLLAYGVRAEEGKRFIKSEEVSLAFSQTNAYNELYMLFFTDSDEAIKFLKGILPNDLSEQVNEEDLKQRMIAVGKSSVAEEVIDPTTLTTAEIAERNRKAEEAAAQD